MGSILDWPLEYRTVRVGETSDGRLYLASRRYTVNEKIQERVGSDAEEEWQISQADDDYYLRHAHMRTLSAVETEAELKKAILATHLRMLKSVPTRTDECGEVVDVARPNPGDWPQDPRTKLRVQSDEQLVDLIQTALDDGDEALDSYDEKLALLLQLHRFEEARLAKARAENPELSRYLDFRFIQAIWASKYDAARAKRPWRDDWFTVFPEE